MAHYLATKSQIKSLEKAVNTAFAAAGLQELNQFSGPIVFTDIPWQNPPLYTELRLGDARLSDYLELDMQVNPEGLYNFWVSTLDPMFQDHRKFIEDGGFKGLGAVLINTPFGQHKLRFSLPQGYDEDSLDPMAGLEFSIEAADLAVKYLGYPDVQTENDYYAVYPDGREIGVKNGKPIGTESWDTDYSGMVFDLRSMPRGYANTYCHYDPLAKVRSLLYENRLKFGPNFEAVDYALQALRSLYERGSDCKLLTKVVKIKEQSVEEKHKHRILQEAMDTMEREDISDRTKIHTLFPLLVPDIYTESGFNRKIYPMAKIPFALSESVLVRIRNTLNEEKSALTPQGKK